MSFVHLHVHSTYSLLDGFSKISKLISRTKEMGMPAVALTDHGTMFGVIEFYEAAKKAGVKPIIGLETYVAPRRMTDKDAQYDKNAFHLLLLAQNDSGYRNLLKIATASQLEGFYYKPRIDHDFLAAHSDGLIAATACMSGEIPSAILEPNPDKAIRLLDWYYEVFGAEHFFLELQRHNINELEKVNQTLLELGKRYNARYIATNDAHYVDPSDARYQDILLAIQTGALLSEPKRMKMYDESYYLRSPQEMATLFADVPEAISNTLVIAECCEVHLEPTGYHLPNFTVPEGYTTESYLRKLCEDGLRWRYGDRANDETVRQRLEHELKIIHDMGFDAYFLIVWDLCRYARENNIWYNTRGSGAGSIVAYSLGITLIEPLGKGLIFERFLNPGRISMPDIDLDFQDDRRAQIMEYCAKKYGSDKVAQIITFGTMGAKAAIRDVGRVMDIPLMEVDRVAKLIPAIPGKQVTITDVLNESADLKNLYDTVPYLHELIDTAINMEGTVRSAGTHAAGVVITDIPAEEYVPLHRPTSNSEDTPIKTVTQFEMSIIGSQGLLKVDFLGLATLTIMQRACQLIKQRHGVDLNLDNIPLDDAESYRFMGEGHTAGIFQLEGNGMTRYLVQMKPRNLDNIIAMVALYRPGPLEFIPSYIRRMHGEEAVSYRHPLMEPIFKETYGIPIYQEQIMSAAIELAGYTPPESDELRSAISKKQQEKLVKHREKFVKGAVKHGIDEETAKAIFTDWENFARYGFNKSHAADYGLIAVQTAYLKTHYAVEYMTALLSASKNDTDKVALYVADCRSMGIEVLPPDINISEWDFSIEDRSGKTPAIRFGLGAIKNVGAGAIELILSARAREKFRDLNDFVKRVDLRQINKRTLECMVKVGALDALGSRNALLEVLDRIMAVSISHQRAAQSGQLTFFDMLGGMEETISLPTNTVINPREQLEWERELMGLYVSAHPLSPYLGALKRKITHSSDTLSEAHSKQKVTVGGMVNRVRPHSTKKGDPMGFATIEDLQGNIELILFPRTWEKYAQFIDLDKVILVEGKVDADNGDPKVLVDSVSIIEPETAGDNVAGAVLAEAQLPMDDPFPFDNDEDGMIWNNEQGMEIEQPDPDSPYQNQSVDGSVASDGTRILAETPHQFTANANSNNSLPEVPLPPEALLPPEPEMPENDGEEVLPQDLAMNTRVAELPVQRQLDKQDYIITSDQTETASPLVMPPYITAVITESVSAAAVGIGSDQPHPRMLKIILRASGEKERDVRRLRRVHGDLRSSPGIDRFSFLVVERGYHYLIEFPNDTTGISPDLIQRLSRWVGAENIQIEPLAS